MEFGAFKSLYDVRCDLSHLSVLTGPNGSGKSNFVEGLSFVADVYQHGLEYAVSRAGGYENIAHRRTRRAKKPISIVVEVVVSNDDIFSDRNAMYQFMSKGAREFHDESFQLVYRHSFAFKAAGQSIRADFEVSHERLEILDPKGNQLFRLDRVAEGEMKPWKSARKSLEADVVRALLGEVDDDDFYLGMGARRGNASTRLVTISPYMPFFWIVNEALSSIRVFQLSPYQVRAPGVPTPNATLDRYGANLPGAADHLSRTNPNAWASVQRSMRSIMPDLQEIAVVYTEDRRIALQFRERKVGRPWNSGEVSDGTIQALALFIALFDPRHSVLVLEEPENSVHPWILRMFVDLCREVQDKQIVLTTHSPVLLNYVDPKIVRLAFLKGGRTHIVRLVDLEDEVAALVVQGEINLFEYYDSGYLEASVPRGMSHGHE